MVPTTKVRLILDIIVEIIDINMNLSGLFRVSGRKNIYANPPKVNRFVVPEINVASTPFPKIGKIFS